MIPRYSRPEMVKIWEPETRFNIWLEIELLACEGWERLGRVPKGTAAKIRQKAKFSVNRVDEIEKETRHDVVAFLTNVAESVGPDSRFLHLGMTSSDVLDTSFAVQLRKAGKILIEDIEELLKVIKKKAVEHKNTVMIGRSHGIHAEPITFGLKLASWHAEMERHLNRIRLAVDEISVGKISGAVGTYAHLEPEVEEYVCKKLELRPDPVATQVVSRDRHAVFFACIGIAASSIERIATEIRHLQRTEVLEAEEFFSKGQKGSSAMPHKRNPVLSENLCGLARLVRSAVVPSLENITLWHERDISHSSVERVTGPDTTILLDFMLTSLAGLIKNLIVYPEAMKKNVEKMGKLIHSEGLLLKLVESGLTREAAYTLVQKEAMKTWEEGKDFEKCVRANADICKQLNAKDLDHVFDRKTHLRHVDTIFRRVF